MSISTYDELKTAVASWLHRTDLTSVIPDFIMLAEERMNRTLRVRQMEAALAETDIEDGNLIAQPDGMVGVKTLWVPNYEASPLKPQTYEFVVANDTETYPTHWAWVGESLYFNGTGSVQGVYYTQIPALSDTATTNWLLTAHPSLYLRGSLLEAAIYTRDPEGVAFCQAAFDATLADIMGSNARDIYSGPLQARARQ
jgi:hypothetical protein